MPGLAGLFAVWAQTVGATMTQHMQINNSFVILIFVSLEEFVSAVLLGAFQSGEGIRAGGIFPVFPAQSNTVLACWPLRAGHSGPTGAPYHAVRLCGKRVGSKNHDVSEGSSLLILCSRNRPGLFEKNLVLGTH